MRYRPQPHKYLGKLIAFILLAVCLMLHISFAVAAPNNILTEYANAGINVLYVDAEELHQNRDSYVGEVVCTTLFYYNQDSDDHCINASAEKNAIYSFNASFENPAEYSSLVKNDSFTVIGLVTPGYSLDLGMVHLYDCHILAVGNASSQFAKKYTEPTKLTVASSSAVSASLENAGYNSSETVIDAIQLKNNRNSYVGQRIYTVVFFHSLSDKDTIYAKMTPGASFSYNATFSDKKALSTLAEDDIIAISGIVEPGFFLDFGDVYLSNCQIIAQGLEAQALMTSISAFNGTTYRAASDAVWAEPTATPVPTPTPTPRPTYKVLQRGSSGSEVVTLQERLIALGYLTGSADGDFGKKTESALTAYQTAANLKASGILDNDTAVSIYSKTAPAVTLKPTATPVPTATPKPTFNPQTMTLQRGDKSEDVRQLQLRLIALGYLTGSADSDFGAKTEAALIAYQAQAGLSQTGICNYETYRSVYSSYAPTPKPTVKPTVKPTTKPSGGNNTSSGGTTYIGNYNSKKFHYSWCASAKKMSNSNKVYLSSRSEAISRGYDPCKNCRP